MSKEAVIPIPGLHDVDKAAKNLLKHCKNHFFFGFYGNLGSGKTTLIRAICRELGSADIIASPTYSLINEYQTNKGLIIFHMDFYRLKNMEEALNIGVMDYFNRKDAYCFIEWPELVESLLPENTVKVRIEKDADDSRTIRIES